MAGYNTRSNRLYRSRKGEFLGVCQGIAEWREFPVGTVRLGFILLAIFTGFLPVVLFYIILGLILPLEPKYREEERERSRSRSRDYRYDGARSGTMGSDIDAEFEDLKSRVKNMEAEEFDKEKDWEERLKKGE